MTHPDGFGRSLGCLWLLWRRQSIPEPSQTIPGNPDHVRRLHILYIINRKKRNHNSRSYNNYVHIVMFLFDQSDFMIFSVIRVKSLLLVSADTTSLHSLFFSADMNVSSISNVVSIRFCWKRFKNHGFRDILVEVSVKNY